MIKTIIKHHFIDKLVNSIFDNLINVFKSKELLGEGYYNFIELKHEYSYCTVIYTLYSVNVIQLNEMTFKFTPEHGNVIYKCKSDIITNRTFNMINTGIYKNIDILYEHNMIIADLHIADYVILSLYDVTNYG